MSIEKLHDDKPIDMWAATKHATEEAIKSCFPVSGRTNRLVLNNLEFKNDDKMHAHDFHSQEAAKHEERTWGVSLMGDVSLIDKETGKEINRTKMKLGVLPKLTSRFSFIVDGGEWQVITQWRLKSGIYGKIKENGKFEAEFNLAKTFVNEGRLKIPFDPETKKLKLNYATTNVPLYSVLKAQGVEDQHMIDQWGKDIFNANKSRDWQKDIRGFYAKLTRRGVKAEDPTDFESIRKTVVDQFHAAEVLPETSQLTVGHPHTTVNSGALIDASKHIIDIAKGVKKPDDVYSLEYKNLMALNDFIKEKFTSKKIQNSLKSKIRNLIDKKEKVSDIISIDLFNKPLKNVFVGHTLAQRPDQVNPIDILSSRGLTTIYGIGGIQNEQAVRAGMKVVSHSHLGFLDPIHTPEGEGTGISLHLPLGVHKFGNEPKTYVFDQEEGRFKYVNSLELHSNYTMMPDQVKYKDGKPYALKDKVTIIQPKTHDFIQEDPKKAKYILVSSKGLFDEATNLIPFLNCNQGNRTMTGAKQPSQSIGLSNREAPHVQVKSNSAKTFEEIFAAPFVQKTQEAGTVHKIEKDELGNAHTIIVKNDKGELNKIPLYNHFPLNDKKSFLHSTPVVKEGDKLNAGDLVADNNYSRNGVLSLGTNIRVAYCPHYGNTFEDGVLLSESAAKKFTSEHLHKLPLEIDHKKDVIGVSKYTAYVSSVGKKVAKESMRHLDSEGIVKLGSKVKPGDILIAGVRKTEMNGELAMVGSKIKGAVQPFKDNSLVWDSDYEGEVVKIVPKPNNKGYTVYVKTKEPAQIGDKVCDRHGAKQIISAILPDGQMPKVGGPDGKHVEMMLNPISVAGRINIGQLLETAASKIAEKTGKPYIVDNFPAGGLNITEKVKKDLADHNISDTEKLWDPVNKKYVDNEILVGNKYMFKLKHQVEKKLSVRGVDNRTYSVNQEPRGGGGVGAQAIGQLEMYALLAHGARENIKEISSYKAERPHDSQMRDTNFWDLVMRGVPLPPPKPTFAYKKFEGYLTGLGLNIHKDGHSHTVQPLTDNGVLALSNGEIKEAFKVRGKNEKEINKGLFDLKTTGGVPNMPGKGLKWCVVGDTLITTDHGDIEIQKIVDEKLDVKVLSYNKINKELEYKSIKSFWENEPDDKIMSVSRSGNLYDLVGTANHNILTTEGEIQMRDTNNKTGYTIKRKLSSCQEQLVLASLLGDAWLFGDKTKYLELDCFDSHLSFLKFKVDVLNEFIDIASIKRQKNGATDYYSIASQDDSAFTDIYNLVYKDEQKAVTKQWLDRLDDVGLAYWFMGDGGCFYTEDGNIQTCILLKDLEKSEVDLIEKWFKNRWDISPLIIKNNKRCFEYGVGWYLSFPPKEASKLIEIISPYIIPCMEYMVRGFSELKDKIGSKVADMLYESQIIGVEEVKLYAQEQT